MRWHVRLLVLCTLAVFIASCTGTDKPTEPAGQSPSVSAPNFDVLPPNTACMGDYVWADTNCNGVQDAGEVGHEGVTVKLYTCIGDILTDETVTDATGYYALFGPPNSYYIVVTLPDGCTFSPRGVGQLTGSDIGTDSDVDETGKGHCTILGDQEIEKEMDAGICCGTECTSTVGDRVWLDENCNGLQDKDEPGAPGIEVTLIDCISGEIVATTTTNASGSYLFTGVADGEYKICIDVPGGYVITLKDQGTNDGLDSDGGASGCTDCFTLECESDLSRDFGLCLDEGTGCRVTGGGVDVFGNWTGELSEGRCKRDRYTFGGQAGANTALPPQPKGEWEHNNHSGPSGSFAFHGGTSSAPDGTEIDRIECSDDGFCDPARKAPTKQIDFWGVGQFHNAKELSAILAANVVVGESLHWFEVNIDDGGEPGRGKGYLNGCPLDGFGLNGSVALVNCDCPDFYRITIRATEDPASPVIYQVYGYPDGGNLQIHPLTGYDQH